jgi:hypothetical protein
MEQVEYLLRNSKGNNCCVAPVTPVHTGHWYCYVSRGWSRELPKQAFHNVGARVDISLLTNDKCLFGVVQLGREHKQRPSFIRSTLSIPGDQEMLVYKVGSPFSLYFLLNHKSYTTGHPWRIQVKKRNYSEVVSCSPSDGPSKWASYSRYITELTVNTKNRDRVLAAIEALSANVDDVTVSELVSICPDLLGQIQNLDRGTELLSKHTKQEVDLHNEEPLADPIGIWICGGPGTGKTSLVKLLGEELCRIDPGIVGFVMAGKSGGFHEGLSPTNEVIICDEFNFDKLSASEILCVVSPQEAIMNKKHGKVRMRRKKLLIIIANYDLEYYCQHDSYRKVWVNTDKDAIRRRFIQINIGKPFKSQISELNLEDKGAYSLQLIALLLSTMVMDVLDGTTLRQRKAVSNPLVEAFRLNVRERRLRSRLDGAHGTQTTTVDDTPRAPTPTHQRTGRSVTFTQSSPYERFLRSEENARNECTNTQVISNPSPLCDYDRIATGLDLKKLPCYTKCRVLSPTRRCYREQMKRLGEELIKVRMEKRNNDVHPNLQFIHSQSIEVSEIDMFLP